MGSARRPVNDRDAAEAIIEHRETLGSVQQGVFYAGAHRQAGPGYPRLRGGGEAIAAIVRSSGHWVTNTARAHSRGLEVTAELRPERAFRRRCRRGRCGRRPARMPAAGLLVNEINHSMGSAAHRDHGHRHPGRVAAHAVRIAENVRTEQGALA